MTWEQFLAIDWKGCDVESQEGDYAYRGPIAEIIVHNGAVGFKLVWCARCKPMVTGWEFFPATSILSTQMAITKPQEIGQGRVMVHIFGIGPAIFFPRTVSRLDPAKVHGLPPQFAEPNFVDPKE